MKELLPWIIPPVLGAGIGFITNLIAIRMLFRPLRQIRIFGIPLPFTPGILPRQRRRLAESIGRMVERELLTPEVIRGRFETPQVLETVKNHIAVFTGKFLSLPLASLFEKTREAVLSSLLDEIAASPRWKELPGLLALSLTESAGTLRLGERSIADLLDLDDREMESLPEKFSSFVSARAGCVSSVLMPWVEGAYAPAVRALGEFLRRPEIHGELEIHGRIFLSAVILKFNVFQRFFISAAQYDRTLEDKMPEIIDELIPHLTELLLEDRFRRDVLARVEKALTGFLSDPSSSLFIARSLGDIVRDELKKPLAEFPWFAAGGFGKKAGGLLKRLIGEEGNAGTIVSVFSAKFIERYGSLGLGAFLMTGAEQKEALNVFISEKLLAAAGSRAEEILSAVSVRTMIRERIDSLEMERVEGIILDVMARELKWIDIFGAILGFLIGVSQLALTRIPGLF